MNRKHFTLGGMSSVPLLSPRSFAAKRKQPNTFLICVDDAGFSDLASQGKPVIKSPNLDLVGAGERHVTLVSLNRS